MVKERSGRQILYKCDCFIAGLRIDLADVRSVLLKEVMHAASET